VQGGRSIINTFNLKVRAASNFVRLAAPPAFFTTSTSTLSRRNKASSSATENGGRPIK
jgi:hypothetical protein